MSAVQHPPGSWQRWADIVRGRTIRARTGPAAVSPLGSAPEADSPQPFFTHHQILELVAPFSRVGHRIDMAASRRLQRHLVFQPVPRDEAVEMLRLESPRPGVFRLLRTLIRADGLSATLQAEGDEPEALLHQMQAVPPHHHFGDGKGFALARSLRLSPGGVTVPTEAVLQTDALTLQLRLPTERSPSAQIELHPRGDGAMPLPDDLLAVLGWDWSLLRAGPTGWRGSVRLHGEGHGRLHDLAAKMDTAARHLAHTLAEPPRRFHERLAGARFGVLLRRSIPLLVVLAMGVHVALVGPLLPAQWNTASAWRAVLPVLPAALLALFFLRSEGARLELPRWPRALSDVAWRRQ